nr:hypothetical protein PanWU01x14_356890 [Ipomoea batatas]
MPWNSSSDCFPSAVKFLNFGMNFFIASSPGQKIVNPPSTLSSNVFSAGEANRASTNTLQPYLLNRLYISGRQGSAVVLRPKSDFSALQIRDIDKSGGAGGLEHRSGQSRTIGDLVELFGVEVVQKDVKRENVLNGVNREVLGE